MPVNLSLATKPSAVDSNEIETTAKSECDVLEYTWLVEQFKDWHQNKRGAYLDSTKIESRETNARPGCRFWMRLLSDGIEPDTGRVNLKLFVAYHSRRWFTEVPLRMKTAVLDENGIHRHTHGMF